MNDRVRCFLGIKEHYYDQISENEVNLSIDYLIDMDVLYQIPQTVGLDAVTHKEYLFTQIGMRYCQATELINALVTSDRFIEYTEEQRGKILQKLESDINGQSFEDVIFYQIAKDFEHLVNEEVCGDIEAKTGYKIVNKAVIYLGENGESNDGVLYINAEDFLKQSKEILQTLLNNPDIKEFIGFEG